MAGGWITSGIPDGCRQHDWDTCGRRLNREIDRPAGISGPSWDIRIIPHPGDFLFADTTKGALTMLAGLASHAAGNGLAYAHTGVQSSLALRDRLEYVKVTAERIFRAWIRVARERPWSEYWPRDVHMRADGLCPVRWPGPSCRWNCLLDSLLGEDRG